MTATIPNAITLPISGTFTASRAIFDDLPELPEGIRPEVSLEFNDGPELNLFLNNEFVLVWKQGDEICNSYNNTKWDNRDADGNEGPGPWDAILNDDQVADVLVWGAAVFARIDIMIYQLLTEAASHTFMLAAPAFAAEDAKALINIPGVTLGD